MAMRIYVVYGRNRRSEYATCGSGKLSLSGLTQFSSFLEV
jgi:hypothetical protein